MKSTSDSKLAPLTAKMESFSQGVADDLNQSDAYRAAYDCTNMKASTIHEAASRLAADYKVSARIVSLQTQTADVLASRRAWDKERLIDESETNLRMARYLGQIAPANKALEIIGRATGVLTGQHREEPVQIRQVTIVLNHGHEDREDETPALEASYRMLPPADEAE